MGLISKALVAHPDEETRRFLKGVLQPASIEVEEAEDHLKAFEKFQNRRPDVVLASFAFEKGGSGFELARKCSENTGGLPLTFVVLLPHLDEKIMNTMDSRGVDEILILGQEKEGIKAQIRLVLHMASMKKESHELTHDQRLLEEAAKTTHDINNRLTPLIGYIQLLVMDWHNGKDVSHFDEYIKIVDNQSRMVKDMMQALGKIMASRTSKLKAQGKSLGP